jgi:hypothetical protein
MWQFLEGRKEFRRKYLVKLPQSLADSSAETLSKGTAEERWGERTYPILASDLPGKPEAT